MIWRVLLFLCFGLLAAPHAWALSPYVRAEQVACKGLTACVSAVEHKLNSAGFQILGVHYPRGLEQFAVVVVTDKAWLQTIRAIGGSAIVGAGIRIGVQANGRISYVNPEYWYRAYLQKKFESHRNAVQALNLRLAKALGDQGRFGGDVPDVDLPKYRYMIGMERFDSDKALLYTHANFDTALKTVRQNLAKGLNHTSQVYEVVMSDRKLAVFGVAMNGPSSGEHVWVKQIGAEHIAALPWEVFIVNGKVYALYGRYRTALGWPKLGLGDFMLIRDHPDTVQAMLTAVAGGRNEKFNDF
jgi:hypothetical protein